MIAKAITLADKQVIQDPRRAGGPLRCTKRSSPSAAEGQPASSRINGGVIGDLDLDATESLGTGGDVVELLSLKSDRR